MHISNVFFHLDSPEKLLLIVQVERQLSGAKGIDQGDKVNEKVDVCMLSIYRGFHNSLLRYLFP